MCPSYRVNCHAVCQATVTMRCLIFAVYFIFYFLLFYFYFILEAKIHILKSEIFFSQFNHEFCKGLLAVLFPTLSSFPVLHLWIPPVSEEENLFSILRSWFRFLSFSRRFPHKKKKMHLREYCVLCILLDPLSLVRAGKQMCRLQKCKATLAKQNKE